MFDYKQFSILIALIATLSVLYNQTPSSDKITSFSEWKNQHKIKYNTVFQQVYRQKIFLQNLLKINQHNQNQSNTYKMGLNQFSSMTDQQFQQLFLSLMVDDVKQVEINKKMNIFNNIFHKKHTQDTLRNIQIDWTTKGAVTQVKDQGLCGSCWAFSATGSIQGLSKVQYNILQQFSQQQLVDCSSNYGNMGCNGGLMTNSFKYIHDKGISLQSQYPYQGIKLQCKKDNGQFKISSYTEIKDCNDLVNSLIKKPISVAVDATNWARYSSGVFNHCNTRLNHGVLLVAVNDHYWKVKNSWAKSWGEKGYIRLARGNTCGVCNMAAYPNK